MTTWTLIVVFSWQIGYHNVAHSGFSVPGFTSRQACKIAQEAMATEGSKSTCVKI